MVSVFAARLHEAGQGVQVRQELPYLPHEQIPATFRRLKEQASDPKLEALMEYMDSTWMSSSVWPVKSWSVFMLPTRTNNDVEGWHRRLNGRAGRGQLQLYVLLPLLFQEAKLVELQIKLVSENKYKRAQRKRYRQLTGKLFRLWDQYREGEKTVSELLRAITKFNGPAI